MANIEQAEVGVRRSAREETTARLGSGLAALDEAIDRFADHLDPILRPATPDVGPDRMLAEVETSSRHISELRQMADHVERLTARVNGLAARSEA